MRIFYHQKPASSHSNTGKKQHHRAIIVKFATYRARQLVLKVRRKLKQSGISIAEDLTAANYKILTTARKSKNVTAAWSQDGRIYVSITGKSDKKHVTQWRTVGQRIGGGGHRVEK